MHYPEKTAEIEEARGILQTLRYSNYSLHPATISTLWKRVQNGEAPRHIQPISVIVQIFKWHWVAAAAIIIGIGLYFIQPTTDQLEYRTQFGETKTILLPDSSTVILNANSTLSFANNWNSQSVREIWLEGEAYFSVTHKVNNQPFKVLTKGGVAVEVLGTTFNVYHRLVDTKIMLNTGQIRLSLPVDKQENTILMKPGELVEYQKNNYSKRRVDPTIYAAWTEKKIILDKTTLQEMIRMAKDNYGIDVEVSSKELLTQTVSGSMPVGDEENFVFQIAKAFQLKVTKEEDKYLINE